MKILNEKNQFHGVISLKKQSFRYSLSTIAKKRYMSHGKVAICIMSLWTSISFVIKLGVIFKVLY